MRSASYRHPSVPAPPAHGMVERAGARDEAGSVVHDLGGGSVAAPFTTGSADISDPEAR
jgi:hypothetical protein